MPSDVKEPDTYDNCIHTDFINPIHPISHSNDGSHIIFDVYRTFKGGDISQVVVDFNDPITIDDVYTKIEEVTYIIMYPMVSITAPWSALHYTATCVDGESKVYIYIHDGSNIINHNYDSQDK